MNEVALRGLTESQRFQRVEAGKATAHVKINGVRVPVLCSQSEVAKELGVSQMMVSIIERQAISKLLAGLK